MTGAKIAAKAARSGCHLFLRGHLSIVSGRWKKIKKDPARLFVYNNRARQMRNEAEKSTKAKDDL